MKKIILVLGILFIVSNGSIFGMVWGNGGCRLFSACTGTSSRVDKSGLSSSSLSISDLEVQAASSFYQSQREYKDFLGLVERSYTGTQVMNTSTLLQKINAVYSSIDGTLTAYNAILQKVTMLPINQSAYYSLQVFDYQGFCDERGLIPSIFLQVEELLKGEPTSFCKYIITKTTEIKTILSGMMAKYGEGDIVEMPKVWNVNQKFNHLDNVGQYIAMVLGSI